LDSSDIILEREMQDMRFGVFLNSKRFQMISSLTLIGVLIALGICLLNIEPAQAGSSNTETASTQLLQCIQPDKPSFDRYTNAGSMDESTKLYGNIAALLLGLVIIPGMGYLWIRKTRRQENLWLKQYSIPKLLDYPPDDLPPALVCLIKGNCSDGDSFLATIFDLANKNIVRLEHNIESGKILSDKLVLVNEKEKYQFEKFITQKSVSSIRELLPLVGKASLTTSKYLKLVEEEAINQGYFKDRPVKSQNRIALTVMFPLFIFALISMYYLGQYYPEITLIWLPCLSIFISGFLPVFFRSTGLTEKGFVEATKWRSFYRYLKITLRRKNLTETEISKWNEYLPYAQIFFLNKKWLKAARKNNVIPPSWYKITLENEYSGSKKINYKLKTEAEYFHNMIYRLNRIFSDYKGSG
jgi:hypothetical protein